MGQTRQRNRAGASGRLFSSAVRVRVSRHRSALVIYCLLRDSPVFSPASSCEMEVRPEVNHFGRSLLGGYSPQYMPDFVLHGVTSDQRLRQCLMADLEHTVLVSSDGTDCVKHIHSD